MKTEEKIKLTIFSEEHPDQCLIAINYDTDDEKIIGKINGIKFASYIIDCMEYYEQNKLKQPDVSGNEGLQKSKIKKETEVAVCPKCGDDTYQAVGETFCLNTNCKWEKAN